MKKIKTLLVGAAVFALLAAGCSAKEPAPTEPPVTQLQQTDPILPKPTDPTSPDPTKPTAFHPTSNEHYHWISSDYELVRTELRHSEEPNDEISEADALIRKYNQYRVDANCCNYENSYEDMSEFLTDSQKENYRTFQQRITCCRTASEVRAHAASQLDASLIQDTNLDDRLFYDDEGNLYLISIPTGYAGYHGNYEFPYSDAQTVVFAEYGYDTFEHSAIILLEKQDGTWMLRSILPLDGSEETEHLNADAYRWLLEELPNKTDDAAYGRLLLDAFFEEPVTFLEQLSVLSEDSMKPITGILKQCLTAEENPLYTRLLDALATRDDLTFAEQDALNELRN